MTIYKKITPPENYIRTNLRWLLFTRGILMKELGIAIGESVPTISNWVRYKAIPPIQKIQKICLFFGIAIDDFVNVDLSNGNMPVVARNGKMLGPKP